MSVRRFYIYCDESIKKGKKFSDFYGGVLVDAQDFEPIKRQLEQLKTALNQSDEIKWTKTDMLRLEPYKKWWTHFLT